MLVIITESNIQFQDSQATQVLFTYLPNQTLDEKGGRKFALPPASGISAIGDTIIIGSIDGSILVFGVWTLREITFEKKLLAHSVPVSDLFADRTRVVSADIDGNIFLWTGLEKKEISLKFDGFDGFNGFPCTSVRLYNDLICAAYGSGHIRVFSVMKRRLLSEVFAHIRWINSLHIQVDAGLLLSVSDDTYLRVWKLNEQFPWVSGDDNH